MHVFLFRSWFIVGDALRNLDYQSFKTIFMSIVLEAFPFILLGVLVSSLLQAFLSEAALRKIIPKNPVAGLLTASLLGIVFPVCECGMIPVARRLIQKGMPPYLAVVYMLSSPIINPVVYFATYSAFRTRPDMVYARMGLAFAVTVLVGALVYLFVKGNPLRLRAADLAQSGESDQRQSAPGFMGWIEHMLNDFMDMAKYLLFGALIASALQVFVARSTLIAIGGDSWTSYPFMMGLAYLLSICSTSDAFVAASFGNAFGKGPLLAFLVMGPMLDLKSTLMMLSAFRFRFVALLSAAVILLVWAGSLLLSAWPF